MPNPFYVQPVNPLEALMAGQQGYDKASERYKQNQIDAARQEAAAALSGGDTKSALAALLGRGDVQGATAVGALTNQQATQDLARQQFTESKRHAGVAEGYQGRQIALSEEAAREKPTYQVIEDEGGQKRIVKLEPLGKGASQVPIAGMDTTPKSPYAPNQKITGDEAKDRLFVNRMVTSHNIINGLENINEGVGGFIGGMAANKAIVRDSAAFNATASADRQKSVQAQRDFVNAILRKESGAAISQGEFENAQRQYFPQPGDKPEVIAQKRQNRMMAIEGMMAGAGKGYQPPAEYVGTKGPARPGGPEAPTAPAPSGGPSDKSIAFLRANPKSAEAFDARYGTGMAMKILGNE